MITRKTNYRKSSSLLKALEMLWKIYFGPLAIGRDSVQIGHHLTQAQAQALTYLLARTGAHHHLVCPHKVPENHV